MAGPTFTRALKNLCNWFWFWTVQYPAFLSHWNTFWLITNQILLPTTFWSNYSPSESIQRWVKTKKILLITSVTQYYKFTLLPKQKSGIPPWSSSCPIFFSLHNVHTTSNTYELVNSISNKAVTTYTGELKYFPTSLCFYFPLLLYFQKRFLLNAGALHGSQTAADWYLQPREAPENNRLSRSQPHTFTNSCVSYKTSPVWKVGKIRWQSRIFIGRAD